MTLNVERRNYVSALVLLLLDESVNVSWLKFVLSLENKVAGGKKDRCTRITDPTVIHFPFLPFMPLSTITLEFLLTPPSYPYLTNLYEKQTSASVAILPF